MTGYDHVASLNVWEKEAKVKGLYLALDGGARKWYTRQLLTGAPATWDEWKTLLRRSFESRHVVEFSHVRLQNRDSCPLNRPNNTTMTFYSCAP